MRKHVHSKDARKPGIVLNFKTGTTPQCSKVTLLVEVGPNLFQAHCQVRAKNSSAFASLGFWELDRNSHPWTCTRIGDHGDERGEDMAAKMATEQEAERSIL